MNTVKTNQQKLDYSDRSCELVAVFQGDLFEEAANQGYDMEDFAEKYMTSNFCRTAIDVEYSPHQTLDEKVNMSYLLREVGSIRQNPAEEYDAELYNWIGVMYRLLFYKTDLSSAELYRKLPVSAMIPYAISLQLKDYADAADEIVNSNWER